MELTVPLSMLRSFRAVLRRLLPSRSPRSPCPIVFLQAGTHGLSLLARQEEVVLRQHQPGAFPAMAFGFAGEVLNHFEAAGNGN
jgi:hypothetical protein